MLYVICVVAGMILGILSTNLFAKKMAKKYCDLEIKRIDESLKEWSEKQHALEEFKKKLSQESEKSGS